jgi:hypothetical protein
MRFPIVSKNQRLVKEYWPKIERSVNMQLRKVGRGEIIIRAMFWKCECLAFLMFTINPGKALAQRRNLCYRCFGPTSMLSKIY